MSILSAEIFIRLEDTFEWTVGNQVTLSNTRYDEKFATFYFIEILY